MAESYLVRQTFKIRTHDLDFTGKASIAAFLRLLENADASQPL